MELQRGFPDSKFKENSNQGFVTHELELCYSTSTLANCYRKSEYIFLQISKIRNI